MADREDVIRKVQALWARADHPNTPSAERESCIAKARDLMAKHYIDELVLEKSSGTKEDIVLTDIRLFKFGADTIVPDQRMKLGHYIAMHSRCRGIVTELSGGLDIDGNAIHAGKYLRVIGFRSDTLAVRIMYNLLVSDMLEAVNDDLFDAPHLKSKKDRENYMVNFCDGFADRINQRLAEIEHRIDVLADEGSLLPVLADKRSQVDKFVDDMYPSLHSVQTKRFVNDPNAKARGARAAERSDVGAKRVGGSRKELS
jgi:hypothetical protein